jgi:hypothetical protein
MISITQIKAALQEVIAEAPEVARQTGFVQRERNVHAAEFFLFLLFGWLEHAEAPLEELTQVAQDCAITISASGLSQRFTAECAQFMQAMLERLSRKLMRADPVDIPLLRRFSAVIVEDSSSVTLPAALAQVWRGCGGSGSASPSAVKLHTRWDLLSGQLQGPLLSDGRLADTCSPFKTVALLAGCLFLADLGYFDLMWLKCHTVVLTKHGDHRLELRGILPQQVGQVREYGVLVGAQARIPARLILVRVPKEVADQRRARLEEEAKDKGQHVSAEQWYLAQWTIVITTVPCQRLSTLEALRLMRVRWQIELLYKLWKEHGKIDEWRSNKPWRILSEVYGKLAAMIVQHWLILLGCWHDPYRSLVKAAKVVRQVAPRILAALMGDGSLHAALRALVRKMRSGCRLNTRQQHPSTAQILLEELDWPGLSP